MRECGCPQAPVGAMLSEASVSNTGWEQGLHEAVASGHSQEVVTLLSKISANQRSNAGLQVLQGLSPAAGEDWDMKIEAALACYPQLKLSRLPTEIARAVARRITEDSTNSIENWKELCLQDVELGLAWLQGFLSPTAPTEGVCCGERTCCATWLCSPPNLCCWSATSSISRWEMGEDVPERGVGNQPLSEPQQRLLWLVSQHPVRAAVPEGLLEERCYANSQYHALVELLMRRGRVVDAAMMAIHADDLATLQSLSNCHDQYKAGTSNQWISVAALFSTTERKFGEAMSIHKEHILEAILGAAGPFVFAQVLSAMSTVWWEEASRALLQKSIILAEGQHEHRSATARLLSKLREHLEGVSRSSPRVISPYASWLLDSGQGAGATQHLKGSKTFEDLPGSWGVRTSLSQECYFCGVPVNAFGRLRAFQCGHCFHDSCVPEKACPICFSETFVSVVKKDR
eukprot:TRINITY_DN26417_c0_g1_i1.p1 TRINITY_DN26417_c0_g1~~TRINITY_DN26417_c0_g1_i1.p1  ORF type:complete len:459 (-),score=117.68 TRINITY_DN26417_c0_g1_i1:339-1715(-)